jgi:hypothetical protein
LTYPLKLGKCGGGGGTKFAQKKRGVSSSKQSKHPRERAVFFRLFFLLVANLFASGAIFKNHLLAFDSGFWLFHLRLAVHTWLSLREMLERFFQNQVFGKKLTGKCYL